MSSDDENGGYSFERPSPQPLHDHGNSSFRSRALAGSTTHRFATSPRSQPSIPEDAISETGSTAPLSPRSRPHYQSFPRNSGVLSPRLEAANRPIKRRLSASSTCSAAPVYTWLGGGGGTGDEPGVDVKSKREEDAWGHLTGKSQITVVDYSQDPEGKNVRVEFEGDRLKEWLGSEGAQREPGEDGEPKPVRWLHVDGINWEVIKTLTLKYGLHPLAVEDALRAPGSPRSKLDFYSSHLYLQILVHHTHSSDEATLQEVVQDMSSWHLPGENPDSNPFSDPGEGRPKPKWMSKSNRSVKPGTRRPSSGLFLKLPEGVQGVFEPTASPSRSQSMSYEEKSKAKNAHQMTVDELSAKYMVPIRRGLLSVFLTKDGTLISMTPRTIREVLHPVYARLEDEGSLLRRSGDVSMLAQALLDVSVDLALEISQTFESEILRLEASVLVDPSIETVRHLHVLSSQLIRLRRSLTPLLHLTYVIRDQDAQRSAAANAMNPGARGVDKNGFARESQSDGQSQQGMGSMSMTSTAGANNRPGTPSGNKSFADMSSRYDRNGEGRIDRSQSMAMVPSPVVADHLMGENVGFFSQMTKVYIGDVLDHLEIIVSNMDQFVATCDHLTDYVFNVLSFKTNASSERLSIVTVVFLPLTFIASYFGMNFTEFPSLENPDSYFWKVAAPATVVFFIIFSWSYIRLAWETILRKISRWRTMRNARRR